MKIDVDPQTGRGIGNGVLQPRGRSAGHGLSGRETYRHESLNSLPEPRPGRETLPSQGPGGFRSLKTL